MLFLVSLILAGWNLNVVLMKYPNPELTPGDILPVTREDICTPGYTAKIRNVSWATKRKVFERYNIPIIKGEYEIDHFISLELGGSNDIKNLWPEAYNSPWGAHEKDITENYLHHEICTGRISLKAAQAIIKSDWYAVYVNLKKENGTDLKKAKAKR